MAKDFHVVRVYGDGSAQNYDTLGEKVKEVGRRLSRPVHVYPFNSAFVEEHPAVLIGIGQSSDGVFVCPSLTRGEVGRLVFSGDYRTVRDFYSALFREFELGNSEKRSVTMVPDLDMPRTAHQIDL